MKENLEKNFIELASAHSDENKQAENAIVQDMKNDMARIELLEINPVQIATKEKQNNSKEANYQEIMEDPFEGLKGEQLLDKIIAYYGLKKLRGKTIGNNQTQFIVEDMDGKYVLAGKQGCLSVPYGIINGLGGGNYKVAHEGMFGSVKPKYGIIGSKGEILLELRFDDISVNYFYDNESKSYKSIGYECCIGDSYGLYSLDGHKLLVPFNKNGDMINYLGDSYFSVATSCDQIDESPIGVGVGIAKDGAVIVPRENNNLYYWGQDIVTYYNRESRKIVLNLKTGTFLADGDKNRIEDTIGNCGDLLFAIRNTENNVLNILDSKGQKVFAEEYERIESVGYYDIHFPIAYKTYTKKGNRCGLINGRKTILPNEFDSIEKKGEYLYVKNDKGEALYSLEGKQLLGYSESIAPLKTFGAMTFLVESNGCQGVADLNIDSDRQIIIPCSFNQISLSYSGLNKLGYLVATSKYVYCAYTKDSTTVFGGSGEKLISIAGVHSVVLRENMILLECRSTYIIFSLKGRLLSETHYDEVTSLEDNVVLLKKGKQYGLAEIVDGEKMFPYIAQQV